MIIDDEFKNLLPPLSDEDYMGLQESLKKEGCRDPLVIWGDILVDGHNRYQICTENGISFQIVQRDFKDRNEVILWIISNQLSRRNLTAFQRAELALRLKPKLSQEAKERQGERKDLKDNIVPKSAQCKTVEKLAEVAGVGKGTIQNTETILNKGTPEDIKQVREGEVSISGKAKEIKERDKQAEETLSQDEDVSKVKDFEEFYLANIGNTLSVLGTLKDLYGLPKKYESRYNRIIKDIEDLRDFIGGK